MRTISKPVVAASRRFAGVGVALLLVLAGCEAVPPQVLERLPEDQARQLAVYSSQHAIVFDLRIHSMDTCPFLTYLPNALFMDRNSQEYAAWLHQFYRAKHEEEKGLYRCKCEQELSRPAEPASSAAGSEPRPADKPPPSR